MLSGCAAAAGEIELRGAAALVALAVHGRDHRAVVLRPAQVPVDAAGVVGVVGVLAGDAEIGLDLGREGQRAAAVETVVELRLDVGVVDRARVVAGLAVGVVFDAGVQPQAPALAFRLPHVVRQPEQAGVEGGVDEGHGIALQVPQRGLGIAQVEVLAQVAGRLPDGLNRRYLALIWKRAVVWPRVPMSKYTGLYSEIALRK